MANSRWLARARTRVEANTATKLWEEVVDGYFARHRVTPGITGWAQINGWRGQVNTPEKLQNRVEHDLYYIENWSLLLDLYILLRTPFALLKAAHRIELIGHSGCAPLFPALAGSGSG